MATITRRKAGYQVQIRRKGFPTTSKCFSTQREAEMWARQIENEMDRGLFLDRSEADKQTFGDILTRYMDEVATEHKSYENEKYTARVLKRDVISRYSAAALSGKVVAQWRDRRLQQVCAATVNRELNLISAAINVARKEWSVHTQNPVELVRRPPSGKARARRLNADEEERLMEALTCLPRRNNGTYERGAHNDFLKPIVQFALETAMRQGELVSLTWDCVNLEHRTAHLTQTKNGEYRTVPLSTRAIHILTSLRSNEGRVFPITKEAVKKAFARACKRATIEDFHFHDLRHER